MVLHSNVCRPPLISVTYLNQTWLNAVFISGWLFFIYLFLKFYTSCVMVKGKKWDNVHATFWCISLYCNSVFKKIIINLFIMYHLRVVSCCDFAVNVM